MWNMAKPVEWDFALELKGVVPDDLPMARLAEYLQEWASLLGVEHRPVFKGIVKGSAVLRAQVPPLERVKASARLRNAANDGDGAKPLARIEAMMAADGVTRGRVVDRQGAVLVLALPTQRPSIQEVTVFDAVDIDGRVVRVEGRDKTAHIGLIESGTGKAISVQTTDDALAQALARHFRGEWVRLRTEGYWVRGSDGRWMPKSLTVLSFEELDNTPASDIVQELSRMPGNGWAKMPLPDALAAWRELRGVGAEDAK